MRSTCGCRSRTNNGSRSEEHTSELQSQSNLVCRLLLEKKKKNTLSTINSSLINLSNSCYTTRNRSACDRSPIHTTPPDRPPSPSVTLSINACDPRDPSY